MDWWHKRGLRLLLFGAGLAVLCVGLINLDRRAKFERSFDGVDWAEAENGVIATRVLQRSPAAKADIRPGDRLISIGGTEIKLGRDAGRVIYGTRPWNELLYQVDREGVRLSKSLILEGRSPLGPVGIYLFLVGLVHLALAAFVMARSRARTMVRHFYAFALGSFVLYGFSYTGTFDAFDRFVYWADVWASWLVPAMFLHFCLVFPHARNASRKRHRASWLVYAASAVFLLIHHLAGGGWLTWDLPLLELNFLLERIATGVLIGCLIAGALVLNLTAGHSEDVIVRQQRKWLAYGTLWGVTPFVAFYALPYMFGDTAGAQRGFAVFSLAVIPVSFTWAVVKHRLMDVELYLRRGLAYTLATGVLLACLYGAGYWLADAVGIDVTRFGAAGWTLSLVVATVLFPSLRDRVQRFLDRRFYRERYDSRRTLVGFASELNTETSRQRMLAATSDRLASALDLDRVAIFAARDEAEPPRFELARKRGMAGDVGAADLSFLSAHATSDARAEHLFFELAPEESGATRPDLNYFVPCRVHGRTIAYLGLGMTRDGDFLTTEDIELVQAISGYFAIAFENARLYESIERKATEYERLNDYKENIVESLSVGILAAGLDDRVESWNTQLELMLGISRQEAIGQTLREILPAALVDRFDDVRGETGIHNIYKFELLASDLPEAVRPETGGPGQRSERTVNVAIAPLVARDLTHVGRLVIFDDISEHVAFEEKLRQTDKLSSIGLLAAGVAHEVNTPLAVIASYAQMLSKQAGEDPKLGRILEKINSQTFRASEIVNSLLNFSRTSDREFVELSLPRVIEDTIALLDPQFRKGRIAVTTEFDEDCAAVMGNAGRLQQVFLNLLLNARDAMPDGGELRIVSRVAESADGTPLAQIALRDTGVGIPPEQLRRIFDPFFTTKGPKSGTGLGLAVSYGIIKEHSGAIAAESVPGEGTTFTVELPLARKAVHA